MFDAKTTVEGDLVRVAVSGDCDLAARSELMAVLLDAVGRSHAVVVELGEVPFMDSSGIQCLVAAHQAARSKGGWLWVVDAQGLVADVLELTGLADVLRRPADSSESGAAQSS